MCLDFANEEVRPNPARVAAASAYFHGSNFCMIIVVTRYTFSRSHDLTYLWEYWRCKFNPMVAVNARLCFADRDLDPRKVVQSFLTPPSPPLTEMDLSRQTGWSFA